MNNLSWMSFSQKKIILSTIFLSSTDRLFNGKKLKVALFVWGKKTAWQWKLRSIHRSKKQPTRRRNDKRGQVPSQFKLFPFFWASLPKKDLLQLSRLPFSFPSGDRQTEEEEMGSWGPGYKPTATKFLLRFIPPQPLKIIVERESSSLI